MIRFGIVGAGGIAKKFARDLAYVKDSTLTAVSARTMEQAEIYQKHYQTPYAFDSYEKLAQSDVIDAVYIGTPHNFHYEQSLMFIKAHKHVLIEKPMTVNAKEAKALVAAAKKEGVLIMEAMWTHFLPATNYLIEEMKKNTFGKLLSADLKFGFPIGLITDKNRRWNNPALAGGSLLDLGIYPVSYVSLLQKSPLKKITAKASFTKSGVDKYGVIQLIDEDDVHYKLTHSMSRLVGDKATLKFEHATVIMHGFHGCKEISINRKKMEIPYEGEGFVHEIRSFVEDIKNERKENSVMSYDKTIKTMELLDHIRSLIGLSYPFE